MAIALVVGNIIGSEIFVSPSALGGEGSVSILAWVFTGPEPCSWRSYSPTSGRAFPRTCGPYAFGRGAFGDFSGFQTAWGHWIALWAVAFVSYASVFVPALATGRV